MTKPARRVLATVSEPRLADIRGGAVIIEIGPAIIEQPTTMTSRQASHRTHTPIAI